MLSEPKHDRNEAYLDPVHPEDGFGTESPGWNWQLHGMPDCA